MSQSPVIILAFANDREGQFLRSIAEEQRTITQALNPLVKKNLLHLEILSNVQATDITEAFRAFGDRVKVLHYGGHANDLDLLLGGGKLDIEGFAQFLGAQEGLELVFMNGCATAAQAAPLMRANIPRVVLTESVINDEAAQSFSTEFYKGLAAGRPVGQSFQEAEGVTKGDVGKQRGDLVFSRDGKNDSSSLPWTLYQQTEDLWVLPTKKSFPWLATLAAAVVIVGLGYGGWNYWKYNTPFNAVIPISYPDGVDNTQHFNMEHTLQLDLPNEQVQQPLTPEGQVQLVQVRGGDQAIPISLKSVLWKLQQSSIQISQTPERISLAWKDKLYNVEGHVRGDEGSLEGVIISLGSQKDTTDAQGMFSLAVDSSLVGNLLHTVLLEKSGFMTSHQDANLTDKDLIHEFYLESDTP